jgi:hypothetical protein
MQPYMCGGHNLLIYSENQLNDTYWVINHNKYTCYIHPEQQHLDLYYIDILFQIEKSVSLKFNLEFSPFHINMQTFLYYQNFT